MKKFICTINIIAILALVPAVLFGYLHNSSTNTSAKQETETVSDVVSHHDNASILRLVKVF